jgi:ribosome modulation factor
MSKRLKATKNTRKEGAEAAHAGQARSSNPYPSSDTGKRNEWFGGYDAAVMGPKAAKAPKSARVTG